MLLFKLLANFIGIFIYFFTRFTNRTDKVKEPSLQYWWKDNWPELITIFLFNIVLMLLVIGGGLNVNFEKLFPQLSEWVTFTGDVALSLFTGLLLASMFYNFYKTKIK